MARKTTMKNRATNIAADKVRKSLQAQTLLVKQLRADLMAQFEAELDAHADPRLAYGAVWHIEGTWDSGQSPRSQRMTERFYAATNKLRRIAHRLDQIENPERA